MKQILYLQGSSLSLERAHWVQILHTAFALARKPDTEVILIPRTVDPEVLKSLENDLGESIPERLTIEPLVPFAEYQKRKISGNLLSKFQKFFPRQYGKKRLAEIAKKHLRPQSQVIVYTRDQEIPAICGSVLKSYHPQYINELHKFEYVNRLQGKMEKNKEKPWTLGKYRAFARKEKNEEFKLLSMFDGITCTTDNIRDLMQRAKYRKPLKVVSNGTILDPEVTLEEATNRERPLDVLYVGQLFRWKNVDLLIQSIGLLNNVRLEIVGGKKDSADMNRLTELVENLNLQSRITFHGFQSHHKVADYMKRSKVGVVPLPRGGFVEARLFCCPLKAIELMAAGTPIVASDLRSVRGLLTPDENAHMVEPDDAQKLADGLSKVLNDRELKRTLIRGGLRTAHELSYDERARHLLEFSESLK